MKSKLGEWFSKWVIGMILMVVLVALIFPGKKINLQEINFITSASSRLYFKNMRAFYYDVEDKETSNFKLYRISSRGKEKSNTFDFVIYDNWLRDEAYILLETNQYNFPDSSIKVKYIHSNTTHIIELKEPNNEANYVFAAQFYEALSQKKQLYLYQSGEWIPFSESEQKSLKKSLSDYFKLVGKLN